MTRLSHAKDERLQVRLDERAKSILEQAAGYERKSLSQFVLATALEHAEQIIQEHRDVTLNDADWKRFYEALEKPAAPNRTLRKAFARYRKASGG